ncbi:MAG: site-specific DNA-methyltransferase [SAR202 cluster bacterium]|nr:site-specific DNA-methyltransferase [SAR202 cluster bacterium]
MADIKTNALYYGDNLEILRRYVPDESVDLIYLDPPFNSQQQYNVLFRESSGVPSEAQIRAFTDTWKWDIKAEATYQEIIVNSPLKVSKAIEALRAFIGSNDVMAYLTMMTVRLVELHRVLKSEGSLYLHCDPTASHYLKVILDTIFDPVNFRNEIIWRRTGTHGKSHRFAPIHDVILFYSKSEKYKWTFLKKPFMRGHVEQFFMKDEVGWKTNYYGNVLTGSGLRGGESGKPWHGFDPSAKGRHWAIPSTLFNDIDEDVSGLSQHQKLDLLFKLGLIKIIPGQAWPIYEKRLKPDDGQAVPDIWAYQPYTEGTVLGSANGVDQEVRWLSPKDQERLGYQTQKPVALLERIISASSQEGDVVLDPFCGCGTAVVAAQTLNRRWVGIDVTHLAITVMKKRLEDSFPGLKYEVVGEPKDVAGAEALARQDRYQFQWWALSLVNALPQSGEKKKGADQGIDGVFSFMDDRKGRARRVIVSVKSGGVTVKDVRELKSIIGQDNLGLLIALRPSTEPMRVEAATGGFHHSILWERDFPRIQIMTIEELLQGQRPALPQGGKLRGFAKARRVETHGEQMMMGEAKETYVVGQGNGKFAGMLEDEESEELVGEIEE